MKSLLLCLAVVGLVGSRFAPVQAGELTVQTALGPGGADAPLFLALDKGWFKEAGLDVDVRDGRGSVNTIQLVAAGQIDLGESVIGPMAVAVQKGAKLKAIAQWTRRTDLGIIIDANSPVHVAKDLKGLRLAIFAASPWIPFVDPFLKNAGLGHDDVISVFVDPAALFTTYSSGRADGIWGIGPYALPIVNPHRPSRDIPADQYGIVTLGTGVSARLDTIAAKAADLRKFIQVTQQSWAYMLAGHAEEAALAVEKARPNAKIDPTVLEGQIVDYGAYVDTPASQGKALGWQAEADWAAAIASMEAAQMLIPGHLPGEFYTNDFIDPGVTR